MKLPMLSSHSNHWDCIAHARMPKLCLVFTPSFFVCIHDDLNRCACVFGTHPCVNLLLVFSVRLFFCMCV